MREVAHTGAYRTRTVPLPIASGRIPVPDDIVSGPIKVGGKHGKGGKALPLFEHGTVERILGDEHQVSAAHSLDLVTHLEVDVSLDDHEDLVMVCLRVQRIAAVANDAHIGRHMLPIEDEHPLDRIVSGGVIGVERLDDLVEVLEVCLFASSSGGGLGA